MRQVAPDPVTLLSQVQDLAVFPGWEFTVEDIDRGQGSAGLTLIITVTGPDSYHPENLIGVAHYFPVPPAAYDARAWRRWLLDRCGDVLVHELCEMFRIGGQRPYAPNHGDGRDPYVIHEMGTVEDAETRPGGLRITGSQHPERLGS